MCVRVELHVMSWRDKHVCHDGHVRGDHDDRSLIDLEAQEAPLTEPIRLNIS